MLYTGVKMIYTGVKMNFAGIVKTDCFPFFSSTMKAVTKMKQRTATRRPLTAKDRHEDGEETTHSQ